jgi:hypothetical protein
VGRVEDFLGGRLRGLDIPDDLRRLVELQLDGVLTDHRTVLPFAEMSVLGPGERHDLEDLADDAADDDPVTAGLGRAFAEVLSHVAVVVHGFNGDLFGYWLHPDEPPTDRPPVVKLDTEACWSAPYGSGLVEAMVWDWLGYDDEDLPPIARFCDRHGLALARSRDDLAKPDLAVDPEALATRLARQFAPYTPRPIVAGGLDRMEGAPPVGLPLTDPRLRRWLDDAGFPTDLAPLIADQDSGGGSLLGEEYGEARIASSTANVSLTLYLDEGPSWWLFKASYGRSSARCPLEVAPPYGFRFDEHRDAAHARVGRPHRTSPGNIDEWRFTRATVTAMYHPQTRLPLRFQAWPTGFVPQR